MINLQEIQLDNKKITLIVLVFLIIAYVDYSYLLKLQLSSRNNKATKIIKLKKDMAKLDKDFALMQQSGGRQKVILGAKKFIPEDQIPALLKNISSLANQNNIRIMQMTPSKELKPKVEKAPKKEKEAPNNFIPILITLDLTCDYHHLGKFINQLENAEEFMAVEEIRIISDPSNYFQQAVNLVLKTYVKS
jgi:Tfp pilus assembly protein PilO